MKEKFDASDGDVVVAKMIRKLRRDREVSQVELAATIEQGRNVLARIERGQRQVTLPELHRICEFLGIPLGDFVAEYLKQVTRAAPE